MIPIFSIIIPVRKTTRYLRQTLSQLKHQHLKSFETLVITDKISGTANPAQKRNLGAQKARGRYLAFLDDDSYPSRNWLTAALALLAPDIAAVCGPCLTPPKDNLCQQASGLLWSSLLGSGGAGSYRNSIQKTRLVDDYPSVNFIVNKKDFLAVNGFDTHHWPGEDTILCLNLAKKLNKKILYHPSIIVYHHRRAVIIPHLRQISRYALHRGHFARVYPQTSLRLGYLLPSLFFIYLISIPPSLLLITNYYLLIPLFIYLSLLLLTFLDFLRHHSFKLSFLAAVTIPVTHLYYGILFVIGFLTPQLSFKPHQSNKNGYIGG